MPSTEAISIEKTVSVFYVTEVMEDGHGITSRMTVSLDAVTTKLLKLIVFSTFLLEAHNFILFS